MEINNEECFGTTIAYVIWDNHIHIISDGRANGKQELEDKSVVFNIASGIGRKLRVIGEKYIGMISGSSLHGNHVLDMIETEYSKYVRGQYGEKKKGMMEIVKEVREKMLKDWQAENPTKKEVDFPSIVGILGFSQKRFAVFKAVGFKNTYSKPTKIKARNGEYVKVGVLGSGGPVARAYLQTIIPTISDKGEVRTYLLRSVTIASIEDRPYFMDLIRNDYDQLQDKIKGCLLVITQGIEPKGPVEEKFIKTLQKCLDGVSHMQILGIKVDRTWKTVRIIRFKADSQVNHVLANIVHYTGKVLERTSYKQVNFERPSLDVFSVLCQEFRGKEVR